MPLRRFRRQYEQLSQCERETIIGIMEAGWSARRVARQLGRSDCVVRRCWDQWIREMSFTRRPSSGRPQQTSCREDHHIVIFSDESRFDLSSDDNRVRVWKPRGERLNPAFALQRHTTPTAGVMVWAPRTLPWPARSPDLSPIEHIWDYLGQRVGHPTSLNELGAQLQQIWNEMSQDIIQNLYAPMPDRIASCIRARGGSTGFHAEIVEVQIEVVSPSIIPSGNFAELNRTVTCMVLKGNDRRTSSPMPR
ncbi:transposable element Tcb2 transposase [Trichonephila clavipes]|nr:transposable element Tcb2 transposase [Trichonephila clavipes]